MNPIPDESILHFITGWDTAWTARSVIAVFGALIGVITARSLWKRRCAAVIGGLWLLVGLAMLIFAAIPQPLVYIVIRSEYVLRLRFIMGGLSVLVLLVTFESIRVTRLQERYALLWVATALVILAAALFPQAVNLVRAVMGMQYVEAVVAVAFMFLVLLAFHFSISVSSIQSKLDKTAQQNAILAARIEDLEKKWAGRDEAGRKQP